MNKSIEFARPRGAKDRKKRKQRKELKRWGNVAKAGALVGGASGFAAASQIMGINIARDIAVDHADFPVETNIKNFKTPKIKQYFQSKGFNPKLLAEGTLKGAALGAGLTLGTGYLLKKYIDHGQKQQRRKIRKKLMFLKHMEEARLLQFKRGKDKKKRKARRKYAKAALVGAGIGTGANLLLKGNSLAKIYVEDAAMNPAGFVNRLNKTPGLNRIKNAKVRMGADFLKQNSKALRGAAVGGAIGGALLGVYARNRHNANKNRVLY